MSEFEFGTIRITMQGERRHMDFTHADGLNLSGDGYIKALSAAAEMFKRMVAEQIEIRRRAEDDAAQN